MFAIGINQIKIFIARNRASISRVNLTKINTHTVRIMALVHLGRGEGEMIGVEVGKTGAKLRT